MLGVIIGCSELAMDGTPQDGKAAADSLAPQPVTAQRCEVVREAGATPATIAALDGRLQIGLTAPQLEGLAQTTAAAKLSPPPKSSSTPHGTRSARRQDIRNWTLAP